MTLSYEFQEERRRRAAEAAEQRQKEAEGKGLKDPEAYKRKIEQREKIEREAAKAGGGDAPLKVFFCHCILGSMNRSLTLWAEIQKHN